MKAIANILTTCLCVILIYTFMKTAINEEAKTVQIFEPLNTVTTKTDSVLVTVQTPPLDE